MRKKRKEKFPEKDLESGSILRWTVEEISTNSNTLLCWRIREYNELKNKVLYYQMFEGNDFSCVFKLVKMEKTLYVALRCRIPNRSSLFYLANGDLVSPVCIPKEIVKGLYAGQFSQELVCSPIGDLAKTGLLTLVFTLVPEDGTTDIRYSEYSKVGGISDIDVLCHDMGQIYLEGLNSDFVINATGASFKAHKYILLARSEFFREFFTSPDHPSEFTVDASAGVLHLVLLYCYNGELPHMEGDCLKAILDVANDLKISSLIERCLEDMKDRIESSDMSSRESATEGKVIQDSLLV